MNNIAVPTKYLIFSTRNSIRRISLDTPDNTPVELPMTSLHNTIAIDYDHKDGRVYWSDVYSDVIRSARVDGSGRNFIS